MRLLEEFWYGNIEPTEYDTSSKEYKKLQELIEEQNRLIKELLEQINRNSGNSSQPPS